MDKNTEKKRRPPIVAVMGHIDHGKSTLLSYIRKSNKPLNEAGGITQHVSAYEVEHKTTEGKIEKITFLDTPGHEAFCGIRIRGANVADIAVLVVSAEDGVKPQTIEAYNSIKAGKTPFIVAINKIDKEDANIERTKQSLAENEIYVEGYGGDISVIALSAKTGEGVSELLDLILLLAEMENISYDPKEKAGGVILESNCDSRKGISAVCVVKSGTVTTGSFAVSDKSMASVRAMTDCFGKNINQATPGSPVTILGWNSMPKAGSNFEIFENKKEAENKTRQFQEEKSQNESNQNYENTCFVPIVLKADTAGSIEAVMFEIKKLQTADVSLKVIASGVGNISENDVRLAEGSQKTIVIGFHTGIDPVAKNLASRNEIEIKQFDIIYKMSEWLAELININRPKVCVETISGNLKILKVFSKIHDRQIVGGRVESGQIKVGDNVRIYRRETLVGEGKIRNLETTKNKIDSVSEGRECGLMIEAKIEIAPGDKVESFSIE